MDKYVFPVITEERNLPIYVTTVGGHANQHHIIRRDGFPNFLYLHCTNGSGKLIFQDREFIINKNSGFYMYPGIPHEYFSIEEPWETNWISFDGDSATSLSSALGFMQSDTFYISETNILDSMIKDIYLSATSKNAHKGFKCSELLYSFLILLSKCKSVKAPCSESNRRKQINEVISFIESNFHLNPSLKDIANIINVSPQYLCRIFETSLSMSPFEFMTKLKIQKAKELLITKNHLTVNEIAKLSGFNSTTYFCTVFKKLESLSPSNFRAMFRS